MAYGFYLTKKINSTASIGFASLSNNTNQPGDTYKQSMSAFYDVFWNIVDGAKLGVEYGYVHRWNIDYQSGGANRISFLFYYDF